MSLENPFQFPSSSELEICMEREGADSLCHPSSQERKNPALQSTGSDPQLDIYTLKHCALTSREV